jgi:muconolactone delta-isomerase
MKTVVSNSMVAHLWAHQSQDTARSGNGNIWFEGTTLYSYQTPIANFVVSPKGERVALISSQGYSPTTRGHLHGAEHALGYGDNKVVSSFHVPYVGVNGGMAPRPNGDIHELNAASKLADYNKAIASARRSRDPLSEWNRDYTHARLNLVQQYIETFGVTLALPNFDDDWQTVIDAVARRNTPEALAKKEQERAKRTERARRDYREVKGIYGADWRGFCRYRYGHNSVFTAEDNAAREAVLSVINADAISAWRNGHRVNLPWNNSTAHLRVKGNNIETSRGAVFPVEHGKKAFQLIAMCREHAREYIRNGHTIHLGNFAIDRVTSQGDVHAGCHFVAWPEVEYVARELGLVS